MCKYKSIRSKVSQNDISVMSSEWDCIYLYLLFTLEFRNRHVMY